MDMAITRTVTTDLIDTVVIIMALHTTTGIAITATIDIIIATRSK
jgi:hypothetical protein